MTCHKNRLNLNQRRQMIMTDDIHIGSNIEDLILRGTVFRQHVVAR